MAGHIQPKIWIQLPREQFTMVHWSFLSKAPKFRGDCKKKHNPVSSRQSGRVHFFLFRHDVKILVGGLEPWNFDDFPIQLGMEKSSQPTFSPSFFRGVGGSTTNQVGFLPGFHVHVAVASKVPFFSVGIPKISCGRTVR